MNTVDGAFKTFTRKLRGRRGKQGTGEEEEEEEEAQAKAINKVDAGRDCGTPASVSSCQTKNRGGGFIQRNSNSDERGGRWAQPMMSTSFSPLSLRPIVREPQGLLTSCSVELPRRRRARYAGSPWRVKDIARRVGHG